MANKQPQQQYTIRMVGLGVIGRNLLLNMADYGFSVAGYDKDQAKVETKIEYNKTIEALQRRQDEARAKLDELKTSGDEAWEDLKTGAEKAWGEVKTAFNSAASKFK